jgi:hypothetical protein
MKFKAFFLPIFHAVVGFRPGRRFARNFGYSTLFSVLFSIFLVWSMPLNRFVPRIENIASGVLNRTVRIGEISTTLFGAVVLTDLEIGLAAKAESGSADGADDESEVTEPSAEEEPLSTEGDTEGASTKKSGTKSKTKSEPMYLFDNLKVDVGMLSMLLGKLAVDVQLTGLGGSMELSYQGAMPGKSGSSDSDEGDVEKSAKSKSSKHSSKSSKSKRKSKKSGKGSSDEEQTENESEDDADPNVDDDGVSEDGPVSFSLTVEDINLKSVLDLRSLLPVPVDGTLNLTANISSPSEGFAQATGNISFSIENLMLSKKGYEAEIFGTSLMVPPLVVSSIRGEIVFENGVGKVTEFKVVSKHIDIALKGKMTLGKGLKDSQNDLYAMVKVEDSYLSQSDSIRTIVDSLDSFSAKARSAHRDDGYYGFKYEGAFGHGKFTPAKEYSSDDGETKTAKSPKDKKRKRRLPKTSKNKVNPFGIDEAQLDEEGSSTGSAMGSPTINSPPPPMNVPPQRSYEPPPQAPMVEPPPMDIPPPPMPQHNFGSRPEPPSMGNEQVDNANAEPPPQEEPIVQPPQEEAPQEEAPAEPPPSEEAPPAVQEEPQEDTPPPPPPPAIDPDEIY